MMRRVTLVGLLIVMGVASAQAQFGNADLEGTYAFSLSVSFLAQGGGSAFHNVVGVFTADGIGNIEGRRWIFPKTGPLSQEFQGTYSATADGLIFVSWDLTPPTPHRAFSASTETLMRWRSRSGALSRPDGVSSGRRSGSSDPGARLVAPTCARDFREIRRWRTQRGLLAAAGF